MVTAAAVNLFHYLSYPILSRLLRICDLRLNPLLFEYRENKINYQLCCRRFLDREIEQAEGLQRPWDPSREGVQRVGRRRRHPRLQHVRAAPGDTVDGAGAGGARHAAGAASAVHRRRRGVLRHQRGGVLGVRVGGVGVPPQRARRAKVGRRAHQRHRLPAEHRLPTRTYAG